VSFDVEFARDPNGYRLCCLEKGDLRQIAWLPLAFANPGKTIKLRCDEGWDGGWIVRMAGTLTRTGDELSTENRSQIVRRWKQEAYEQRKAVANLEARKA
jgi:hypothetical protein